MRNIETYMSGSRTHCLQDSSVHFGVYRGTSGAVTRRKVFFVCWASRLAAPRELRKGHSPGAAERAQLGFKEQTCLSIHINTKLGEAYLYPHDCDDYGSYWRNLLQAGDQLHFFL